MAPTAFTNPCTTAILLHNVLINCAQVHGFKLAAAACHAARAASDATKKEAEIRNELRDAEHDKKPELEQKLSLLTSSLEQATAAVRCHMHTSSSAVQHAGRAHGRIYGLFPYSP